MTESLWLACIDSEAPPLFHLATPDGARRGYEPAVGELLAEQMGRTLHWLMLPWAEMIPAVQAGRADAVLCGQGIIPARQQQVDFTRPYAVFHESVLVRRGEPIHGPADLAGKLVAAISDSTNMALAQTFPDATPVAFGGGSADVFGDMLAALRNREVDAVVDDDVVFVPLDESPEFALAFTVPTGNRWGIGVAKDRPDFRDEIDGALAAIIDDDRLAAAWQHWLPSLDYPFAAAGQPS